MNTPTRKRGFVSASFKHIAALAILMAAVGATGLPGSTAQMPLNARTDFGATGDNAADDSLAITKWIAAVISSGQTGYLPVGTYKCSSQIKFLLNDAAMTGCTFQGDGVGRSVIDVTRVAVSPQALLTCTSSPRADNLYFKMTGIAIHGSTTGIVFQMGNDNFSDPVNEPVLDIKVLNFNREGTARAIELNHVLNGDLRMVANVGGNGCALTLNQCCFNTFRGSYSAIQGTSIRLTKGYSYGNVFLAPNLENVAHCVVIDGTNCVNNTFIGGTWSYTRSGILATAGCGNRIINPHPNPVRPGTVAGFVGSAAGVLIESALFPANTPAVPASGTSVSNATGLRVQVAVWGGSVSSVNANGSDIGLPGGTFIVNPGETIGVSYSSKPTWLWTPIP